MTYPIAFRLQGRHSLLEAALSEERNRPAPDASMVSLIKKRKLQLKDRLQALEKTTATDGARV